jgi:hypothetical protein
VVVNVMTVALLVTVPIAADAWSPLPAGPTTPDIPAAVFHELESRGCKLPDKKSKGVIIHGEFFRAGQSDWAALCSTKTNTSLLVFPKGSQERVEVLEVMPSRFSKWSISVINKERLNSIKSTWGWRGPAPSEIDHQGISSFVEFGNKDARCFDCYSAQENTHYFYQENWLSPLRLMVN